MADDPTTSPDPAAPSAESPNVDVSVSPVVEQAPAEAVVEAVADAVTEGVAEAVAEPVEQTVQQIENQQIEHPAPEQAQPATPSTTPSVTPPAPSVAATLTAEPLVAPAGEAPGPFEDEEGGEWELLLQKLRHWLNQNELQALWSQASKPVTALAALVGLLLVLRIYSALLGALDSLPLVPGLLELAGVVWVVRYGVPKLLRTSERERLLGGLNQRWKAFRGKG
jgi:hypothetical protein